ncbi:hypothetical protein E2C01_054089 [Portunus trituberculatus]|uniref:Uncharacterized protein n=1 Tax=Portunus trituberculatus TaxID=210409 RepID=A0A5B7GU15_PORTR|nr:hypothetical protein [Portunus trituberculatus]
MEAASSSKRVRGGVSLWECGAMWTA